MLIPSIDYENPYALGVTETEYTVDYPTDEGAQGYAYFAVGAENELGKSAGSMVGVFVGAPYEMPVAETVPNGALAYTWTAAADDDNTSADGGVTVYPGGEFVLNAVVPGWVELGSGKISMKNTSNPTLSVDTKGDVDVKVLIYGPENSIEKVIPATDAYTNTKISLLELADEPWVRLIFLGEFDEPGQAYVKNIVAIDLLANNITTSVSAPSKMTVGDTAKVTVTVKNEGENTAAGYSIKLYANDEVVDEIAAENTVELDFFEMAEYEMSFSTSIFDKAGQVNLKAEVTFAADEKPADNTAETAINVTEPKVSPVDQVVAYKTEDGVAVQWTVKENAAEEVVEDFEDIDAGIYGDGSMGVWTTVDGDKNITYGWSSSDVEWEGSGLPYAIAVVNPEKMNISDALTPASGSQCAMFMSGYNEEGSAVQNDDYLISPMLLGDAQTISFMAMPMTTAYGPEALEIMASSTTSDVDAFETVASFEIADEYFTRYTADLPAGTKYFALHYVSNDIFALFIDDITYTAGGAEPTGFNIYIDDAKVATAEASAREYVYEGTLEGDNHTASVTALYDKKESLPVSCVIAADGIDTIKDVQKVEVYSLDGIRINDTKNLKAGVYVVNGKKMVIK